MELLMKYLMEVIGTIVGVILIFMVKQYIIPWMQAKIGDIEYDNLVKRIKDLMVVAEDHYGPKTGVEKKQWVIGELKRLGIDFDETLVSALIDGFVKVLEAEGIVNVEY